MMKLFDNKIEKNINIKIFSLAEKYTKELTRFYFSFHNWREITKVKVNIDELPNELGINNIYNM